MNCFFAEGQSSWHSLGCLWRLHQIRNRQILNRQILSEFRSIGDPPIDTRLNRYVNIQASRFVFFVLKSEQVPNSGLSCITIVMISNHQQLAELELLQLLEWVRDTTGNGTRLETINNYLTIVYQMNGSIIDTWVDYSNTGFLKKYIYI